MRLVAADSSSDVLPTPAVAGWRRWIWPVVVLALSAAAVAAGVYANRFGADLTTDSGVYMAAGMMRTAKSVPVAMGEESLSANVSIVWEIR